MHTRILTLGVIAGILYAVFALLAGPTPDIKGVVITPLPVPEAVPRMHIDPAVQSEPIRLEGELPTALQVFVHDVHGTPVPRARLSGSCLPEGQLTGADGTALIEIDWSASRDHHLLVEADGWESETRKLSAADSSRLEVMLNPGAELSGRVVWTTSPGRGPPDGPGPGVEVLAWPVGEMPSDRALLGLDPLRPPAVQAITTQGGRFSLFGIRKRGAHTIAVRAPGLATTTLANHWMPGVHSDCRVEVAQLYGLALTLADQDGGPLLTTPTAFGQRGVGFGIDGPGHPEINIPAQAELFLAGLDIDIEPFKARDELLLVATADPGLDSVGPCSVQVDVPGYAFSRAAVSLPRLTSRVGRAELRLERTAASFADLQVEFVGAGWAQSLPNRVHPFASLIFDNHQGDHIAIGLADFDGDAIRCSGVPTGEYRARLDLRSGLASRRPMEFGDSSIRVSGDVALTFDLSGLGTATCVIHDETGATYDGYAVVQASLTDGSRSRSRPMHFQSGPYVVEGLPAGNYDFALLSPPASTGGPGVQLIDQGISVDASGDSVVAFSR